VYAPVGLCPSHSCIVSKQLNMLLNGFQFSLKVCMRIRWAFGLLMTMGMGIMTWNWEWHFVCV